MAQDLFTITDIQPQEGELRATVKIHPEHPIFAGHFPGAPVTPGVMQLEMVKALLRQHFQNEIETRTIRTCKFLEVLDPRVNAEMSLVVKYKGSEMLDVTATGHHQEKTFFKLQATFQPARNL